MSDTELNNLSVKTNYSLGGCMRRGKVNFWHAKSTKKELKMPVLITFPLPKYGE